MSYRQYLQAGAIAAVIAVSGCASVASQPSPALAKAATDLGCPADDVTVSSTGKNTYRASGCGRFVAYNTYGQRTLANLRSGR